VTKIYTGELTMTTYSLVKKTIKRY